MIKKNTIVFLFILSAFFAYGQKPFTERDSVLGNPFCQGIVLIFPQDTWICSGIDSVFFVTNSVNYNIEWEESHDNGINWIEAGYHVFDPFNHPGRDSFFINVQDTEALKLLYRVKYSGTNCPIRISQPVKVIPYVPNTSVWTGYATDGNWENPQNWLCNTIPNENTDVLISSGLVNVNANETINSLKISSSAYLQVSAGINLHIKH